jgi:hypothetical protein
MTEYRPICFYCKHLKRGDCKAFPDGIPDDIWEARSLHRTPFPGDQGIQFEHDPKAGPLPDYYSEA